MPIVRALSFDLVDVVCSGQGGHTLIRVYIDKPGGVTIGDCEEVHVSLGHALDVADPIPYAYTLEVSSPGLDRPLKQRKDYDHSLGTLVRIKVRSPVKGRVPIIGRLSSVDETGVTMMVATGKASAPVHVSWTDIIEARREVEF